MATTIDVATDIRARVDALDWEGNVNPSFKDSHCLEPIPVARTEMDGYVLGNPTQLGIPLALGFLGVIVDRGRWLGIEEHPFLRWLILVPTLPLLALSTRTSIGNCVVLNPFASMRTV